MVFEAIRQLMAPPDKPRKVIEGFKVKESKGRYKAKTGKAKKKGSSKAKKVRH